MKIHTAVFLIFIALATNPLAVFANEANLNGASLTKNHCAECHGDKGNSRIDKTGNTPIIAGFTSILIFDTLMEFKQGERKSIEVKNKQGRLTSMAEISKKLTEDETEAIAFYLSKQTFVPAQQPSDKKLVSTGKQLHLDLCNDCHGDNGKSAIDDAPILAGQWKTYLIRQFEQISSGERYVTRRMKRKYRKLNDDDKKALIEFYTSEAPTATK